MPAALLMAVSLASFQETIGQGLTPVDLLTHLDETIQPYNQTTLQNCAMLYVEICPPNETHSGVARVVNAGCITPIVRRANGDTEWVDAIGMPLGVGWGASSGYQEVKVSLNKGDMLVLSSDGVIEAKNPADELLGFERFEQAVMSGPHSNAADMLAHLQSHVTTFMGDAELHDDLTIVVVRV
jgi:serine phosphatase RsbU (regulator of sigma subunit)